MFTKNFAEYVSAEWEKALPTFGNMRAKIENRINEIAGDEQLLVKLAYASLPTSDVCTVPFETIDSYAKHALKLREESPYCKDVPEDIFLHFVFYPRVNSEDLVDCRSFFHGMIADRIKGMDASEAALEINRWCAENVTYQASNDRTENPITAYRGGLGRCGEESTFAVTAYRSVGMPARQIYTPYWSHCDDNHAWVEVYVDGQWYFLGACEPEPILNRGWFTDASSRALLEYYRTFFSYRCEGMVNDRLAERNGIALLYNVTDHYAETTEITICCKDEAGAPVPNADIHIDVVNMAALRRAINNFTDENGCFTLEIGKGSAHIEAFANGLFAMDDVMFGEETDTFELIMKPYTAKVGVVDLDFIAPLVSTKNRTVLTKQQQETNGVVIATSAQIRSNRIDGYYLPEYRCGDAEWAEIFRLAGGNAAEIYAFYMNHEGAERETAKAMLHSMETKDYRDTPCEMLEAHFAAAAKVKQAEAHFVEEVLNPRMKDEMLEDWRVAIDESFTKEQKDAFAANPESFMEYIKENYGEGNGKYYPILSMKPSGTLAAGMSDELGRRLLFVAGMRTLGVPARINPADGSAEYWDGVYHAVSGKSEAHNTCLIKLIPEAETRFVYAGNYTLSRWDGSYYRILNYTDKGEKLDDPYQIPSCAGDYRLCVITRLPNGNQLCRLTYFKVAEGETVEVSLDSRKASPEEMLANVKLEEFSLTAQDGSELVSAEMIQRKLLLVYLDVRKEPTEHILNEVIASAGELNDAIKRDLDVMFVVHDADDLENLTLKKALAEVPGIKVVYDDFAGTSTMLARKLFLEPGVWPLLILTDSSLRGYYGSCGYQVGVVDLSINLAKAF